MSNEQTATTFDMGRLRAALGNPSIETFRETLGVHTTDLRNLLANGVDAMRADKLATRCGLHPFEVWPTWLDVALAADREKEAENKRLQQVLGFAFDDQEGLW